MKPQYHSFILQTVSSPTFLRATFSGTPRLDKSTPFRRVTLRLISLKDQPHLQVSRFTDKKDLTQNVPLASASTALADILPIGFANVHLTTTTEEIDLRLAKKLDLSISRRPRDSATPSSPEPHNRPKNLPLPEGPLGGGDHFLQLLGIMTPDGKIRASMRPKFTQINEFLKLLDPLLNDLLLPPKPTPDRPLQILDCACGLSYLTFATHHYLNHIKKIPARILGIDLNDDLIKQSIQRTHLLSQQSPKNFVRLSSPCDSVVNSPSITNSLQFQTARIGGGALDNLHPDIVLALHACDTATDDALAQAVKSNARIILAVPCCHKNLNASLDIPALAPVHRHGILHQRLADLLTDSFRALILRIMGYRTDVIEFISPDYTPKNLMIRALKTSSHINPAAIAEYLALKQFTQVTPYLEPALGPLLTNALQPQSINHP